MKNKILNIVGEINQKSNYHNGATFSRLQAKLKIHPQQLKKILNELYVEGKIYIRQGANQKLIFVNE